MNNPAASRRWAPWVPWYLLILVIATGYPFYFAVPAYLVEQVSEPPAWHADTGVVFDGSGMASLPGKQPTFAEEIYREKAYWISLDARPESEPRRMRTLFSYGSWLTEQCILIGQERRDLLLQFDVDHDRHSHTEGQELRIRNVFARGESVSLGLRVDGNDLRVYRNNALIHEADLRRLPIARWCTGCYVSFGNDVSGQTPWAGTISAFAWGAGRLADDVEAAPLLRIDASAGLLPEALRFHVSNVWLRESDIPWRSVPFAESRFERNPWRDWAINIVLLFPLGFAANRAGYRWFHVAALGFFCSLTIETMQLFLPHRQTDATDLLLNTIGAALGGVMASRLFAVLSSAGAPASHTAAS